VKLELTEAEVKDIVLRHIREVFPTFPAPWRSVEFDCGYGYFRKAVVETRPEEGDGDDDLA
jgi:hypothetical protein